MLLYPPLPLLDISRQFWPLQQFACPRKNVSIGQLFFIGYFVSINVFQRALLYTLWLSSLLGNSSLSAVLCLLSIAKSPVIYSLALFFIVCFFVYVYFFAKIPIHILIACLFFLYIHSWSRT